MNLGRRVPTDFEHVRKYPLTLARATAIPSSPVVCGFNWYEGFDAPTKVGNRWMIGRAVPGDWGQVRGGHAICARPKGVTDHYGWWSFFDQGNIGSCVGFACARMMALLNRHRYNAPWLYHGAQLIDGFEDTPPAEGTSVRAGLEVLRTVGPARYGIGHPYSNPTNDPSEGISAYRWCRTVDEVLAALGMPDADAIPLLQSWGRSYPHITYLPVEGLDRLLSEDGEAGTVTDR